MCISSLKEIVSLKGNLNGVDSAYWLFQDFEGKQCVAGHGLQSY